MMKLLRKRKDNYQPLEGVVAESETIDLDGAHSTGKLDLPDYTIDEAIEKIGFGKFQLMAVFVVGMAWIVVGMETMVLAIVGPILICEWDLPTSYQAVFTMFSYGGNLTFSWFVGTFADLYGRKMCLTLSSCLLLFFGFLCALAPNVYWMIFLRFLVGATAGGTDMAVVYYIELLPVENRGKSVLLINLFFAVGGTLAVVFGMIFLDTFGWRVWIFLCASPALGYLLLSPLIPESPRLDLARGRVDLAQRSLQKIAAFNGHELPEGDLKPMAVEQRAKIVDLVAPGYRLVFVLVTILWFSTAFTYYGLYFLTAELVEIGDNCIAYDASNSTLRPDWACHLECGHYSMGVFMNLLFTSLSELSGLILPMFLLDSLGRRKTIFTLYFLISLVCSMLLFCLGRNPMIAFLFLVRTLSVPTLQLMYLYTPEVYPTKVRAMSLAIGAFSGKVGAIVTPLVAQVLLNYSTRAAIAVYLGVAAIGAVAALLLPIETSGKILNEKRSDVNSNAKVPDIQLHNLRRRSNSDMQ